MLRREEAQRLCAATQAAYGAARGADAWLAVTEALQRRVAAEAGFATPAAVDAAVAYLRCAQSTFAGDAEVLSVPLYVRFNRCRAGTLAPGDAAPDAPLLRADGRTPCSVHALHAALTAGGARPLLLVGGSYT
jgi:hypothetical protein